MINNQFCFLETIAATAGDISMANHNLSITGCPTIDFRKVSISTGFKESLVETPTIYIVTPTAANSTEFTIVLEQYVPSLGINVTRPLTYVTASSGDTATTICNAWRTQLLAYDDIQVTGTGTATLILTGSTGSPIFLAINNTPTTTTVVATPTSVAIVSSTDATPIVVTTAASTYVVGEKIVIAGHITNTNANGTWRISATNGTTTVTLENSTATGGGAGGATGTVVLQPQYARGTYAAITALGGSAAISGHLYSQITFDYISEAGELTGMPSYSRNRYTLFVYESASNYAAFRTRINEVVGAFPASGSTYPDHETLAVADSNLGGL